MMRFDSFEQNPKITNAPNASALQQCFYVNLNVPIVKRHERTFMLPLPLFYNQEHELCAKIFLYA